MNVFVIMCCVHIIVCVCVFYLVYVLYTVQCGALVQFFRCCMRIMVCVCVYYFVYTNILSSAVACIAI